MFMRRRIGRAALALYNHNTTSSTFLPSGAEANSSVYRQNCSLNFRSQPIFKRLPFRKPQVTILKSSIRCESGGGSDAVTVTYRHGLPVISVILPSRHERCLFTLRPLTSTVGQLLNDIKVEDKGVDTAVIYGSDGVRVASSTQIEHLLSSSFKLKINDITYDVHPPPLDEASSEHITQFEDIKEIVAKLYNNLNIDHYCSKREQEVMGQLENLKAQLEPLEKMKQDIEAKANFRTNVMVWGGLAVMATQFGILARLTWWEYSWDIMEPVTYFITYGTAMIMYGYFILTKQEYIYPDARDRQFLRFLHKAADKSKFDVSSYNSLCHKIQKAEADLRKLREPLRAQMPIEPSKNTDMKDS